MVSTSDFDTLVIVLVCGVIGIVNAMIFNTLNDRGVIINELLVGTISITDLMIIVILVWLMLGIIIAAVKN